MGNYIELLSYWTQWIIFWHLHLQVIFDCTILKLENIIQAYPFVVRRHLEVDQGSKLCKRYKSYLNFVRCEYRNHCEAFRTWDVSSYGIVWNCNVLLFVLADVSQCFTSLKTELLPNHNWNGRSIIFSGCFSICFSQIKYKTKVLEVCHKILFTIFLELNVLRTNWTKTKNSFMDDVMLGLMDWIFIGLNLDRWSCSISKSCMIFTVKLCDIWLDMN